MRVRTVLEERQAFLRAHGLPDDQELTWEQRGDFNKWAMENFAQQPFEQRRDAELRRAGRTERQIGKARRSRFNLEKQRRAGSSQLWELLSYTGYFSEDFLQKALENIKDSSPALARDDAEGSQKAKKEAKQAKDDLRYANQLQKMTEKNKEAYWSFSRDNQGLLEQLRDGTLKRKVNLCVMELGRGRLRGDNPDDFVDIGTNRDRSVVARILDGARSQPSTDRFKQ